RFCSEFFTCSSSACSSASSDTMPSGHRLSSSRHQNERRCRKSVIGRNERISSIHTTGKSLSLTITCGCFLLRCTFCFRHFFTLLTSHQSLLIGWTQKTRQNAL